MTAASGEPSSLAVPISSANQWPSCCYSATPPSPSAIRAPGTWPLFCRQVDVLVAAAGVVGLIGADAVKPGATVVDVGIHCTDNGLCGDVDAAVRDVAGALTGSGP